MTIRTLFRWIAEVPKIITVLSFRQGVIPWWAVRFNDKQNVRIRVRRSGSLTLVNRLSAMVFLNIWVRHEYPQPKAQDIVLDLGANVGLFTTFALSHGAIFCHCVEPCPASIKHLEAHIKEFGFQERTNIVPKAVGETASTGFIAATSNVNNIVSQEKKSGLVEVEIADVSQLIDSLSPAPTYIKFDIETNEVPVLRRLLSASSLESVQTIAVESLNESETIASLLQEAGFVPSMRPRPSAVVVGVRSGKGEPRAVPKAHDQPGNTGEP
jgi:FkbM family methyltransferase